MRGAGGGDHAPAIATYVPLGPGVMPRSGPQIVSPRAVARVPPCSPP
jgi:hypothetical protein